MRLPPLNALRAFEAAARHGGFVGASEELHVTRGAISHQVKLLEDTLGAQLFLRNGKGVELTEAGRRLLPALTEAFGRILEAASRVAEVALDLRIICPPATSIRWLLPRLDDFRRRYPAINVRLTTDFMGGHGFDPTRYDLGFSAQFCADRPKSIAVLPLFETVNTVVCAPSLLKSGPPVRGPSDLRHFTLLHDTADHGEWKHWIATFGVDGVDADAGLEFPNLDMATKAAVMGTGVAMADLTLCREEIESGALVQLFPDMVCPYQLGPVVLIGERAKWDEPKIRAFREWVVSQVEADRATPLRLAG